MKQCGVVAAGNCLGVLLIIALFSFWTQRSLDWLCTHFAGHVVHVPYWLSFLATLVLNGAIVAFNVIIEIIRLFM